MILANPRIGFPPIRTPLFCSVIEGLGYAGDFKSLFKDYDKQQKGTEFWGGITSFSQQRTDSHNLSVQVEKCVRGHFDSSAFCFLFALLSVQQVIPSVEGMVGPT